MEQLDNNSGNSQCNNRGGDEATVSKPDQKRQQYYIDQLWELERLDNDSGNIQCNNAGGIEGTISDQNQKCK